MDLTKIYKRGLVVSFLLLIFIIGVLFIPNANDKQIIDEKSLSLSASEDPYEPNNDYTTAFDLTGYYNISLSSIFGLGAQHDDDWYRIDVALEFEHLIIECSFSNISGNIDMDLYYDSDPFNPVATSWTENDYEYIYYSLPWSGIYYIKIHGLNNTNNYNLRWMGDDIYEENDDWTMAHDISGNEYISHMGIQADEDWYMIWIDPGEERIYAELSFSHAAGNIDMEIWYWDGSLTKLAWSDSLDDNEYIDTFVPWPGTYYIKVFRDNAGNSYNLWWEDLITTGGDDDMEENDDYWSAQWVNQNDYYHDLRIVYSDEDWFRTYLNPGDVIDVSIYFDHMAGDLQLELYDPFDTISPQVESKSGDNDELISFTIDTQGDWRIRVYHAFGDSEVWYNLEIRLQGGGPGVEDNYEDNDDSGQAFDLTYYEGKWLSGIDGFGSQYDDDWYKINVEPSFEHLFVGFHQFDGDIQLEVYDESLNVLGGSHHDNHDGRIIVNLPSSGNYYFKVYGDNKGTNYDLQYIAFCLLEEQTLLSDAYGMGVQDDFDFYLIDVTFGFLQLQINLTFTHTLPLEDINMTLYNEMSPDSFSNNTLDDNEFIDVNLDYPGMYFLVIYGFSIGNEYDLWWDDIKTDPRSDDDYEENDDWSSAYDLTLYEDTWLMPKYRPEIHTYEDWYKIYVNRSGIQADEDWYKIYIDKTHVELFVAVSYDSAEGLMGFDIYDADINKITGNFSLTDNDYILYEVPSNGTYYIRVFGDNSGNVYNLRWATREPEEIGIIPGYDLLILIASIIGVTTAGIKIKRSKLKHK